MSFKSLEAEDFLVSAESVTATVWSTNSPVLSTFFTSSAQVSGSNGAYYFNIYQTGSEHSGSQVQFGLTYGHKYASGSAFFNSLVTGSSPTRTVYGQYRNLIYGDENANFIFGGVSSSDFYAISIDRSRYKEHLLKGTINLTLKNPNNPAANLMYLTDNSRVTNVDTFLDCGRVYQIVSGSNGTPYSGDGYFANTGSYGLYLPDIATIILHPFAISQSSINVAPSYSYNAPGDNLRRIFTAITGGASFQLNSEETVTSDYVFIRPRNSEFNYSENPSFISGSTGDVLYDTFINSPQSFITTVDYIMIVTN
jgi:hypothetical protein